MGTPDWRREKRFGHLHEIASPECGNCIADPIVHRNIKIPLCDKYALQIITNPLKKPIYNRKPSILQRTKTRK